MPPRQASGRDLAQLWDGAADFAQRRKHLSNWLWGMLIVVRSGVRMRVERSPRIACQPIIWSYHTIIGSCFTSKGADRAQLRRNRNLNQAGCPAALETASAVSGVIVYGHVEYVIAGFAETNAGCRFSA